MPENITITVDDTTETVSLVVTSNTVFGRSLPVVAVAGDYDTDEVTEATNLYYTEARVSANSAVSLNTSKVTFPEAPSDGTPYARQDVGWVSAAGGDYADGGEAGGANRTLGNTDNFSLGFLVNGLKALLLKPIATAVNWLSISPSITNESVLIEAEGTDTNIDIALIPKGSGKGGIGTTTPASTWQVKGSGSTPGTIADGITFFTDNTGIFENYGSLTIALSGVSYYNISPSRMLFGTSTTRPAVLIETPTATNAVIIPKASDDNTGLGTAGADMLSLIAGGVEGIRVETETSTFSGAITQNELSADPANPVEGSYVQWMSDGVGSGDDGDIMVKITAGGVTKTTTLLDFSTL